MIVDIRDPTVLRNMGLMDTPPMGIHVAKKITDYLSNDLDFNGMSDEEFSHYILDLKLVAFYYSILYGNVL